MPRGEPALDEALDWRAVVREQERVSAEHATLGVAITKLESDGGAAAAAYTETTRRIWEELARLREEQERRDRERGRRDEEHSERLQHIERLLMSRARSEAPRSQRDVARIAAWSAVLVALLGALGALAQAWISSRSEPPPAPAQQTSGGPPR